MTTDEFFPQASEWPKDLSRRSFLEMAAASLALAGFTGCTRLPVEKIVPYVNAPEDFIPGKPAFYTTTYVLGGLAHGIVVESHMGRPTKIDGNPLHPANLGAATAQQQAFILSLYDQDRSAKVTHKGRASSWAECKKALTNLAAQSKNQQGKGLYFLTELTSSPTLLNQFSEMKKDFPEMKWIPYEPFSLFKTLQASQKVFGKALQSVYQLDETRTIVCFDADLFGSPLYPLRYARDFMAKRRAAEKGAPSPRLFVVEPTPSLTGAWTSNRLAASPQDIQEMVQELFRRLEKKNPSKNQKPAIENFLQEIQKEVQANPDHCLFIAGESTSETVHEICHHLNSVYGKKSLRYVEAFLPAKKSPLSELKEFIQDLNAGKVEGLIIFGANPVYNSPAALGLEAALSKAKTSFHFSLYPNETTAACQWRAPAAHPLEFWSDARAFDGTLSLQQPLIEPLFAGHNLHSLLSLFSEKESSDYELLQSYWQKQLAPDFKKNWEAALSEGLLATEKLPPIVVPPSRFKERTELRPPKPALPEQVEVLFRPDETIWDGRFANNPWLQELPKPLTKLTWENAALVSETFAKKRGLKNEQRIKITTKQGELTAPIWILSGQAEDTLTLTFGYGRNKGGSIAKDLGYNACLLWDADRPDSAFATVEVLNEHAELACTQTHHSLGGEELVQKPKKNSSLYPQEPLPPAAEAWAMVIDLDSCIGCSACTLACQSENNIPVVGKKGVLRGREMHWIRVDRYFSDESPQARTYFQPVPCMHCEKAPCELVCPVAATVHSDDGLNQMVYNRCIGTRYCSNNCPYKVRRFNFFSLNSKISELGKMQKNPEVSVRSRGVMEKCTYCIQRIQNARITAKIENRPIADGEVITACQATCPTQAISFGNKNDLKSRVHELRQNPRHFALLEELGTLPRTTYLAKIEDHDHA